jgi:aspartokinase
MGAMIQCGGLMERGDLCLVEVMGFDWRPGHACGILGKFGRAEIALSYLIVGNAIGGDKNMSFCLRTDLLASKRHLLDEIKRDFKADKLEVRAPVVILTLYGPHFLEKFNLANEVFSALCTDGIDAHTVSSSINSISVVVDTIDRDRTVACLRQKFTWPE